MSHPDPLYDPDNSYEDDMNYDDYNDFHDGVDGDDRTNEYWPNLTTGGDDDEDGWNEFDSWDEDYDDTIDDSMDGDAESAFDSIGWGCDEQYGYYGEDF